MAGTEQSSGRRATGRGGIGCLLLAMVALGVLGVFGLGLSGLIGGAGDGAGIVEVTEDHPAAATDKLAIVEVSGVLVAGTGLFGAQAGVTREALAMLDRAAHDDCVRGVLLQLDTPGGSVTDSDLIRERVVALQRAHKPVVVLMGDLCASGGYYVAVAAEKIYALHTTVTGSIGVIIAALNASQLLERIGVKDDSITSGPNKALLSPTRPVDPAHVALLQGVVDEMYDRFVQLVAEGRHLSVETVHPLADGRVFTAAQAKAAGLIDEIGYREDALAALRSAVGGGPYVTVRYLREPSLLDLVRAEARRPSGDLALVQALFATPRAMYLFSPFAGR